MLRGSFEVAQVSLMLMVLLSVESHSMIVRIFRSHGAGGRWRWVSRAFFKWWKSPSVRVYLKTRRTPSSLKSAVKLHVSAQMKRTCGLCPESLYPARKGQIRWKRLCVQWIQWRQIALTLHRDSSKPRERLTHPDECWSLSVKKEKDRVKESNNGGYASGPEYGKCKHKNTQLWPWVGWESSAYVVFVFSGSSLALKRGEEFNSLAETTAHDRQPSSTARVAKSPDVKPCVFAETLSTWSPPGVAPPTHAAAVTEEQ